MSTNKNKKLVDDMYQGLNQNVLEQCGYDIAKMLKFMDSKPFEYFKDVE
jgi:hypothetical protein